jgi:hypothetical protein
MGKRTTLTMRKKLRRAITPPGLRSPSPLAGSARIALRSGYAAPQWILSDHLGSTNIVTDASGNLLARTLYW